MKKCFVRVIHMVSITELNPDLSRTYLVSVIVYVDLRTFIRTQNELSGEEKWCA